MQKGIFIILSGLVLFSCKKKDKNDPPVNCPLSVTSIAGAYKITAMTYKQNANTTEIDYLSTILPEPCRRDDVLSFSSGGTYQNTDAGVTCSPSGNDNGTWALSGNTMTIDGDATNVEYFDCKTLILVNTDTQEQGDRLVITLTKQ